MTLTGLVFSTVADRYGYKVTANLEISTYSQILDNSATWVSLVLGKGLEVTS